MLKVTYNNITGFKFFDKIRIDTFFIISILSQIRHINEPHHFFKIMRSTVLHTKSYQKDCFFVQSLLFVRFLFLPYMI